MIKSTGLGLLMVLGLLLFCYAAYSFEEPSPTPSISPSPNLSPSPGPSPLVGPSASPLPLAKLTSAEATKLLADFQRAQTNERAALDHRNQMEIKELKYSQAARQKEFENREKESRHVFFREHSEGPKRREYVQDFMERRTVMVSVMKEEKTKRSAEHEIYVSAVREDQVTKLKDFKEALAHGDRPLPALWPRAGQ